MDFNNIYLGWWIHGLIDWLEINATIYSISAMAWLNYQNYETATYKQTTQE
jgi:hypothetical protein